MPIRHEPRGNDLGQIDSVATPKSSRRQLPRIPEASFQLSAVLPFPPRGPFAVYIGRAESAWLVVCRNHGWLHGSFREAFLNAVSIAAGFGVSVKVVG